MVAERDSAGIRIVESAAPGWPVGREWRVAPEPAVEIGVLEGEDAYLLSQVEGAVRMSDGRIVVANRRTNQLRVYDAEGRFVTATGGSGSGPGEYQYLRAVLRCGADSIFGFDLSWQMSVYDAAGNYVRRQELEAPGGFTSPYQLACGTNGVFVASGWGEPIRPEAPGFFRTTAPITLFRPGEDGVTLADTLSSERLATSGGSGPHPWGRAATMAVGADAVYLATGETFDIGVFGLDGSLRALFRAPPEDVSIGDVHVASYREEQLANMSENRRQAFERSIAEVTSVGAFPTYTRLVADAHGNLWAERFTPPGESGSRWAVFDPRGAFLGHVAMPEALEVTEIGSDYVLGIHRDELDVERVRLYAIERPEGAT